MPKSWVMWLPDPCSHFPREYRLFLPESLGFCLVIAGARDFASVIVWPIPYPAIYRAKLQQRVAGDLGWARLGMAGGFCWAVGRICLYVEGAMDFLVK